MQMRLVLRSRVSLLRLALGLAAALWLGAAAPAPAATIQLGNSGWEASFDSSLDAFVDITVDDVDFSFDGGTGAVFIQKTAEFRPTFSTVPIAFNQTDANAVGYIVINDEIITNNSGIDWIGFDFELLDGLDVRFDPNPPGGLSAGGFDFIAPFTNDFFSADQMTYTTDTGVVSDGSQWFPGDGATNGELTIEVLALGDGIDTPFTTFTLKETPIPIPEPSTFALVAFGAVLLGCRGRRRAR